MTLPIRPRTIASSSIICAVLGVCLLATPISSASTNSSLQKCADGRAASYGLKASDGTFLSKFLGCLLQADDLHPYSAYYINSDKRFPANLVNVCTSTTGKPDPKEVNFTKEMAGTVAGFATAAASDDNLDYVNKKLSTTYGKFCSVNPRSRWYTFYGDTTPPSPTLRDVAEYVASAQASVSATAKLWGYSPPLAIDTVVQPGVWFHDGKGSNLRYAVLIYEGGGADPGAAP